MNDAPKTRSSKLLPALAVLAALAAGAFFGISYWEKQTAREVEEYLKSQGDFTTTAVKVSICDKSVTITGLKGRAPYMMGSSVAIEMESAVMTGANLDAYESKGVVPLADSLNVKNLVFHTQTTPYPSASVVDQEVRFASLSLTKIRGNAYELVESGKKTQDLADPQALTRAMRAANSLQAESATLLGYEQSVKTAELPEPLIVTTNSMRSKDFGMLDCGPSTWANVAIHAGKQELLTIASMSVQRMSIPDVFTPAVIAATPPKPGQEAKQATEAPLPAMLAEMEKKPLVLNGFSMSDISCQLPEPVTLKNLSLDMELSPEKLLLKSSFAGLTLPLSAYLTLGDDEIAQLARLYGKPLLLSGGIDLLGTQKNGQGELRLKNTGLTEQELGSCTLDLSLLVNAPEADTLQKLLESTPDWWLKSGQLTVVDKKILELVFTALYQQMHAANALPADDIKDAAGLRASAVQSLKKEAEGEADPDAKAILDGTAKLIQQPGSLVISLNPEKPMHLSILELLMRSTPGAYKATAEYTPGQ